MVDLSELNEQQKQAVMTTEGPVIAVAAAGSGKTRCLTYRIAHLLDMGVDPRRILAITFTNKAAGEIKERVSKLVGDKVNDIWIGTFHGVCLRILKRYSKIIGYESFTIYDDSDQDKLIKSIISAIEEENPKTAEMVDKDYVSKYISRQKSLVIFPEEALINAGDDDGMKLYAQIYQIYQQRLKHNSAMDFDDLILNTFVLLTNYEDVRELMQNRFKYIMVDESQDTDDLQFKLISILGSKHRNIFICGDDCQSIYAFRNANFRNFLNFTKSFEDAKIVKVETNYRSTQIIVDASNELIKNNKERLEKICVSNNGKGRKINLHTAENEYEEASAIASIISDAILAGNDNSEIAVLYRTNFQSRVIEQELIHRQIPYNIISGLSFFDRKEIKDMVSYMKFILNPRDSSSFTRIVNVPKRGVGDASVNKITRAAYESGITILEQIDKVDSMKGINKNTREGLYKFKTLVEEMRSYILTEEGLLKIGVNIADIYLKSGYKTMLEDENTAESEDRAQNIEELISMGMRAENDETDMYEFVNQITLMSDQDMLSASKVNMMTTHAAKGLEYNVVIIAGANDGFFPHSRSVTDSDIEEERRLFYVAMTRAKHELNITATRFRFVRGELVTTRISPFVNEIPEEYLDIFNV